jgi:cell wall-associated NlpC family hydrolase
MKGTAIIVGSIAAVLGGIALIRRGKGVGAAIGEGVTAVSKRQQAMDLIPTFMNTPYLWGGTKPDPGFDCSGFVQYLYGQIGISIPRLVTEQAAQAPRSIPVAGKTTAEMMAILVPGDCIALDYNLAGRDDHVGFYVGNGRIVHASGGKDCPSPSMRCKVVEDPLSRWLGKWETVFSWFGETE